jgi:predicted DNA-binding transcriptional regulator AlpA
MAAKLVNIQELAEQCDVSVATARYWVSTKYTPPHVRLGRRLVWRQEDIDRWLEDKFQAAAAAREDIVPAGQLALEVDSPSKAKRTAGAADTRKAV